MIDEIIINKDEIKESHEFIYRNIKRRCQELIGKHPVKKIFSSIILGSKKNRMRHLKWK